MKHMWMRWRITGQAAWRRVVSGVSLIELIGVAVILGVFALIVVPNVVNSLGLAKSNTLKTQIATVQEATDSFYAQTGTYPSYCQPSSTVSGCELYWAAGDPFVPDFLRTSPSTSPAVYGLVPSNGAVVYWGVDQAGAVFATQTPPNVGDPNGWQPLPARYSDRGQRASGCPTVMKTFATAGTYSWTPNPCDTSLTVALIGGGAGGAGGYDWGGGGGGGGGAAALAHWTIAPGASVSVTVGAGGNGLGGIASSGSNSNEWVAGSPGGASSVTIGGATLTAGGGAAGTINWINSCSDAPNPGGAGGSVSVPSVSGVSLVGSYAGGAGGSGLNRCYTTGEAGGGGGAAGTGGVGSVGASAGVNTGTGLGGAGGPSSTLIANTAGGAGGNAEVTGTSSSDGINGGPGANPGAGGAGGGASQGQVSNTDYPGGSGGNGAPGLVVILAQPGS